eukprot:1158747-Pelagomonas_calceolata.AAC.18
MSIQVYLSQEELGWRPSVKTWCDKGLPERLPMLAPRHREYIYSLFDAHVDPGLAWLASRRSLFDNCLAAKQLQRKVKGQLSQLLAAAAAFTECP